MTACCGYLATFFAVQFHLVYHLDQHNLLGAAVSISYGASDMLRLLLVRWDIVFFGDLLEFTIGQGGQVC